jgi:predicted transcriptional regulator of viral defense system
MAQTMARGDALVLELARQKGILRARDLEARGLGRVYLRRLVERGLLQNAGRGLYVASEASLGENQTLAEVARRVPGGVVCLLSALRFHNLGTQNPHAVWLMIEAGKRAPRLDTPYLEVVRQSGAAWREGVETHEIAVGQAQVAVRVTSPAKTVADCWKFRARVGPDVALEALRDGLRSRKTSVDDLWHYGQINRVSRSLGPAMEAMLAQ